MDFGKLAARQAKLEGKGKGKADDKKQEPKASESSYTALLATVTAATAASKAKRPAPAPAAGSEYDAASWAKATGAEYKKRSLHKDKGWERSHKDSNKGVGARAARDQKVRMMEIGESSTEAQRIDRARAGLERKAQIYKSRSLNNDQLEASLVDFASKPADDGSDASSRASSRSPSPGPQPAAATAPASSSSRLPLSFGGRASASEAAPRYGDAVPEAEEWATYIDEFGRERSEKVSALKELGFAEQQGPEGQLIWAPPPRAFDPQRDGGFSMTESGKVLQEVDERHILRGPQQEFPVYEPSPERMAQLREASASGPLETHFDPTVEARTRGAMYINLGSQGEDDRTRRMAALKHASEETRRVREENEQKRADGTGPGQSEAEKAKEERKRMLEAKKAELARKRAKKETGAVVVGCSGE